MNKSSAIKQMGQLNTKKNCCCHLQPHPNYEIIKKCKRCRKQIRENYDDGDNDNNNEFCNCLLHQSIYEDDDEFEDIPLPSTQPFAFMGKQHYKPIRSDELNENNNQPSTSSAFQQTTMYKDEKKMENKSENHNNNESVTIEVSVDVNSNQYESDNNINASNSGLVDSTGFPSYDSAAKLPNIIV